MSTKGWMVVSSKSDLNSENSVPTGSYLIRSPEEAIKCIKENNIKDPVIISYEEFLKKK